MPAEGVRIKDRASRDPVLFLRVVVGLGFTTIVVLTIAQVFFRFALDSPLTWSEELSKLLLVWVVFVGAAVVCWDGRHLSVDVFFRKLPTPLRRAVRVFNVAVAVIFLGILVYTSIPIIELDNLTDMGALGIPSGWIRAPATVGGGLMIVIILLRWFRASRDADVDPM